LNIVLIGMRGSGKTVVGRLVARRLGKRFVEMDEMIVQRMGLTIPEIVEKYGWDRFREVEAEVCHEVAGMDEGVNATGGGVGTREGNIREFKKTGKVFWLKVSVDTLLERIGDDPSRPSLTGKSRRQDMESVMKERVSLYDGAADFAVETEGKTPEDIAAEVIELYKGIGLHND